MKTQDLLIWGGVAVGAYFLWTQMAGASTSGTATQPGSQGVNAGAGYGSQVPPWAANYGAQGWPPGGGMPTYAGGYGGYGASPGTNTGPVAVNGIGRRRIRVN